MKFIQDATDDSVRRDGGVDAVGGKEQQSPADEACSILGVVGWELMAKRRESRARSEAVLLPLSRSESSLATAETMLSTRQGSWRPPAEKGAYRLALPKLRRTRRARMMEA